MSWSAQMAGVDGATSRKPAFPADPAVAAAAHAAALRQQIQNHWEVLEQPAPDNPGAKWMTNSPTTRPASSPGTTSEFVNFLPHVQRFLYGEGRARGANPGQVTYPGVSPPRHRKLRCTYPTRRWRRASSRSPIDLYFFDLDVVVLTVEIQASDIPLDCAQETLFRLLAVPIRSTGSPMATAGVPEAHRMAVGRGRGAGELRLRTAGPVSRPCQPVPCPDPGRALGFPAAADGPAPLG